MNVDRFLSCVAVTVAVCSSIALLAVVIAGDRSTTTLEKSDRLPVEVCQ